MKIQVLNNWLDKHQNDKIGLLVQFMKFGLVGVSNTAISYGTEMLCYYVLFKDAEWNEKVKIAIVSAIAFFISVTNSYFWNSRFVFSCKEKKTFRRHLWAYCKTVLCYGVTGLILAPILKMVLSNYDIVFWLSSLSVLIITIPLNFVLNKFWAFAQKKQVNNETTIS